MKCAKLLVITLCVLAFVGQIAPVVAGTLTVVSSFPADHGPGYKIIPDTQGAVGPHHVVDFDGLNFVVHDKQTGTVLLKKTQREFWATVEPANTLIAPNPWDPRFLYDATSGRWIGVIASDGSGLGYLAVSTSSDPTKPWKGVVLPMERQDLGFKAGVDKNGFYACYASAAPGRDTHTLHDCIAIPKEDLIAPDGPRLKNLVTFTKLEIDTFPATDLDPEKAPGAPEVILNKEFGNDCAKLYLCKITWSGKTASLSPKQEIPLNRNYRSPNTTLEVSTAVQPPPGVRIRAPRRTISVFQSGDSVFQCNNAKLKDESRWGIFWCQVRVSDGALVQECLVDDPNCDYLIPSLAVDKDGNVGIGCTRTSATEFPSVYVMVHAAGDHPGTTRTPVLAVPGTTYYHAAKPGKFGTQWGNYSETSIDPSNPRVFWTCQEYANSTTPDQWCTAWAAFQLDPSAGAAATKAVQDNAPPAPARTTPAAISKTVTVGSDWYLVCNYDDLATRNYTVVIPEGLKTVRGLLVNGCYSGGDSRPDWTICEYYRQFMHLHGFAYVGCTATAGSPSSAPPAEDTVMARHRGIFQAFQDCMRVIASASQHPELGNAPYVAVGFSAGGGFAFNVMAFAPEKTIAAVSYCSPYNFKRRITPPPSQALLSVLSICITGEQEEFNVPAPNTDPSAGKATIDEVLVPYRPQGAEYAWLERQGLGHAYDENRQDVLGMPLLDAAVRARYPKDGDVTKGPIKLLPIDPSTGWIADNTTWKSGLTKIVPARQFKGDLGHSSWLLNEDLAFIYRAYATYDKPLTITSPGNCWPTVPALESGASAPIIVDASKFPHWKTMAYYDGAKKLAEITHGPPQFTATNLTPGYHVFSVLATDAQGNVRTADPKMVVVRRPPTDVSPIDSKAVSLTAEPVGGPTPDSSFTVTLPDMPPTFHALFTQQDVKAKMTIYLPRNYNLARKHPLLVYLNGWDGGDGNTLGAARGITGQQDFVCVSLPLFRAPGFKVEKANTPGTDFILTEPDGRAMWPLFKTMLDKVGALVPNIDKSHRVVGGFSNGAHAIAALIDGSNGEICKLFSAFLIVEGGDKLQHFEYLKGKLYLMVSSQAKSKPRALQITEQARAAGARTTFLLEDVGRHDFPVSAYPAVRMWLRGPALE